MLTDKVETIVSTLLEVGDRVMEVSRDRVVTRLWNKEDQMPDFLVVFPGMKISEIFSGHIITQCNARVEEAFASGKSNQLRFSTDVGEQPVTYSLRFLPVHPDKEFIFVVIENLAKKNELIIVEDKWKLALDAAGDGMWELNMETDKFFFSDKWHEIFGYDATEISTGADWAAKIHPEDLPAATQARDAHMSGSLPSYNIEVRYLCKDGTYKWILSRAVIISNNNNGKPLRFIGTHTDINERKLAEKKYAASAQLLSKLINNLQSGIVVTDADETILFSNQKYCDIFGMKEPPDEMTGTTLHDGLEKRKFFYKHPELVVERVRQILSKKEIVLNEELELTDGRILSRDYLPLFLDSNNMGEIWKFKDISMQKNIDRRFEEQRKFYENILNHIPADIAIFDAQHRYLFANRNAFKNNELREWMIGKTDLDYAKYSNRPQSFVDTRFALYDSAIQGKKKVELIEKLIGKDGIESHHLRLLNPVFFDDGSLEFLLAYGVDISELIFAQEAIKANADMFASAFDYSGIGMALVDPSGTWIDVNNVICQQTGYSKEELRNLTFQDITYPDDLEMDLALLKKMLKKEISTYTIEKRYVSKERKIVLASLTVSLVWNTDGTPRFFIAQIQDITKRKELEKEIIRKNAELEATRNSLINKIDQLEELSHIVAHNLRGPAGNIKMLAEALDLKIAGGPAAEENALSKALTLDKLSELIGEGSESLMESLATLMKITEIKLNKQIPYNDCSLTAVINDITTQLHSTVYEKSAVITLALEQDTISYPKAYLENLLYNLISNSLKYSRPGVPPEVLVSSTKIGDSLQISVRDNGLGINLQKYGGRIFKLNQVFHEGYDSKGIGLYMTKTQVESLGGKLEVKSKEFEGSEFIVTI